MLGLKLNHVSKRGLWGRSVLELSQASMDGWADIMFFLDYYQFDTGLDVFELPWYCTVYDVFISYAIYFVMVLMVPRIHIFSNKLDYRKSKH